MSYLKWAAKQRGNPVLLAIAGIGIITGTVIFYRSFYSPWARRRRMDRNESYARMIIDLDKKKSQDS